GSVARAGGGAAADAVLDRFWARAAEAGLTVLYHGGESYYSRYLADWGENDFIEAFRANAFRSLVSANALQDTIASLLAGGLFDRFPRLRGASIEAGSAWVCHLFETLKTSFRHTPVLYPAHPPQT